MTPVHDIVYHSFFFHLIGQMLCVTRACYPDQSLPIGLVYKLPLFSFSLLYVITFMPTLSITISYLLMVLQCALGITVRPRYYNVP